MTAPEPKDGDVVVALRHNPKSVKPWRVQPLEYRAAKIIAPLPGMRPRERAAGWYDLGFLEGYGSAPERDFRKLRRAVAYRHELLAALEVQEIEGVRDGELDPDRWERVR